MHLVADQNDGNLGVFGTSNPNAPGSKLDSDLISPITLAALYTLPISEWKSFFPPVGPVFVMMSPSDPTYHLNYDRDGKLYNVPSSYAANLAALTGPPNLNTGSIADGLSQTIMFSERYSFCDYPSHNYVFDAFRSGTTQTINGFNPAADLHGSRPASFADKGWYDVVPVTSGFPAVSRPSVPGVTFQVQPTVNQADPFQLQTPYPSGLLVAMFDGRVRTIRSAIQESAYWAAVTPAAGDIATLD